MSQRLPASRPASRSPPGGQGVTLPPVQERDDPQLGGRYPERQRQELEARGFQQQVQPSPQHSRASQQLPAGDDWRSSGPSRDLAVHSILNPAEPERAGLSSRRLSGPTAESPLSAVGPPSQFGASPTIGPSHNFPSRQSQINPQVGVEGYDTSFSRPRRILTPRSPSSGRRGRGQGTIDAQQSPFLPSRGRGYGEQGPSENAPMPTPPAQGQQQYGFPPSVSTPVDQRASMPSMHNQGQQALPQSTSPSISASSQNPSSSQTSPASFLYHNREQGTPTTASYFPPSTFGSSMQQAAGGGGGLQFQGRSGPTESQYSAPAPQTQEGSSSLHSSSAGSSRQTSASDPIQVLTITTSSGQYRVPVDVHQASRLADEKRARNAGASARFRQRRKEKEKEASTNIEKLQQQTRDLERRVREVEHERDFYRGERDRFRDAVFRTPEMRHLAMQAPPSPQSMRPGSFQGSGPQMGGPQSAGYQPPTSGPERAPRRRRIDTQGDFTGLPYNTLPPASTLPLVPGPGFPPGPQGPPSLPPLRIENPNAPQTTGPNHPPSTTTGPHTPYDNYARGSYDRAWPGDNSRR